VLFWRLLCRPQQHAAPRFMTKSPYRFQHPGRASLASELGAVAARCERRRLAGRAISLPFTAVLTGPQRTTTDNAGAASACVISRFRRQQSYSI
jgi:hypothetical protein